MAELPDTPDLLPAGPEVDDDGLVQEDLPPVDVLDADEPAPPGRSWLFDMGTERFVLHGGRPQETRGTATLVQWIDKFLHTQRGALAIHPDWFGLPDPYDWFGRPVRELSGQDLLRDVQPITNHPNIAEVVDATLSSDPLEEVAYVELTFLTEPPSEDADLLTVRVQVGV
jgi:hypothetical protein